MLDRIKEMLIAFSYITTGTLLAVAMFLTVFEPDTSIPVKLLWQIVGVSFICALGNMLRYFHENYTRKQQIIRLVIHYLYINGVVLGCGYFFHWFFAESVIQILCMIVLIAVIYVTVSLAMWNKGKRESSQLNKHLREYQEKKEHQTTE